MKKLTKIASVLLFAALSMAAFGCKKGTDEPDSTPVPPVDETVSPVAFSVAAGEVEKDTPVALSTSTEGAEIYYLVVKGDDTATLTAENYKTAGKYADPIAITEAVKIYAIAAKGEKVSEVTSAAYTIKVVAPVVPEDAMRLWTAESTATAWSVYNYEDLEKLAEVVNGGTDLAGIVVTQKEDIAINAAVLGEAFAEPEEAANGEPNANLKNFAGIGSKKKPFAGTYDGNGKKITGLYIYGGQQGLGFFGALNAATIKNVVILDGCVINKNAWEGVDDKGNPSHDGSDDDRFGGLVGIVIENGGEVTIENCIFVGTVGSQVAKERGSSYEKNPYEYIGGIIGRVEKNSITNLTNCFSLVKLYGSSAALVKTVKGTANFTTCYGVSLDKTVYTDASATIDFDDTTKATIIEAVKTASGIDLTDYFTKAGL
jgi:hypothetical protein